MAKKITIYVHDENCVKLDEYKNKSSIVNEALNLFFSNKSYFLTKKMLIEEKKREYTFKAKLEDIKLKECEKQINEINEKFQKRPQKYEKSVQTLKNIKNVNMEDVQIQANKLGVSLIQFKTWLLVDGHYEEIFKLN